MAEAELLITPDVARAELNRAVNQLEKAMAQAAKNAGKDFEDEISRGIKAGGRDGMGGIGGGGRGGLSTNMIDGMKKAGGVLGGAAVMALGVGINEIMARVDIASALIEEKAGSSQAPETIAAARDLGLTMPEYQAIRADFAKAGIREDADILETLREITVKTEEAERGEGELLGAFKGQRGAELYRNVFASLGNMGDPAQRMAILAQLNEEATGSLSKLIADAFKPEGGGLGAGVSASDLFKVGEVEIARAKAFQEEADKVEKFRADQYVQTQHENARFWNAFNTEAANAYFARQDNVSQQQTQLLGELGRNVQAANRFDEQTHALMGSIAANVAGMSAGIEKLADKMDALIDNADGAGRALEDAKDWANEKIGDARALAKKHF